MRGNALKVRVSPKLEINEPTIFASRRNGATELEQVAAILCGCHV
jgi:hypothetical protein